MGAPYGFYRKLLDKSEFEALYPYIISSVQPFCKGNLLVNKLG